jgi:hypothetical protein
VIGTARARRRLVAALMLACSHLAGVTASGPDAPTTPVAESRFDRPAMWVADRATFTIEIACPPGVDILVEDLAPDKLQLTALDVVTSDSSRRDDPEGAKYTFRYVLTTFRVDTPSPAVGPLPVRYYAGRAGQRPEQATPAGVIYVPGAAIVFRSLLPDDEFADVRDGREVPPRRARYRLLGLAGLAALIAAAAPALVLAAAFLRRSRREGRAPAPTARQARRTARAAYDELYGLDVSGVDARRAAFARLDAAVRHHLAIACAVQAPGLTPGEIADAIEACATAPPAALLASVLDACERARYADPARRPSVEEWQSTLAAAGEFLAPGA